MDQAAVKQNEDVLGQFLDKSDKKFVGQVGVMALTLLTEQFTAEQYKQFLDQCVDNAVAMHRYKMTNGGKLSGNKGETTAPQESGTASPARQE
jgi:hypothetical protein